MSGDLSSQYILGIFLTIGMIAMGVTTLLYYLQNKKSVVQQSTIEAPKAKRVRLFNRDGILLQEYNSVFVSHWSKNIYNLTDEFNKRVKLHKGSQMLLIIEDMKSSEDKNEQ